MSDDPEIIEPEVETSIRADLDESRANRFYDRIRKRILRTVEMRGTKLGRKGDFLLLAPDVFILLFRLFNDDRVSAKNKALLGSGLAYFIFPLDVVPEAIFGPIGFLDDLVFGVYILNKMLTDTDEEILRQHWSGDVDLLAMIRKVLMSAEKLVSRQFVDRIRKIVG
ncbi:MAG: DUF1232 domain-containing protein [Acidobacteria bacterium]|nr:DUF1232 domain-containing protein [Acidobacteriota bacterium]